MYEVGDVFAIIVVGCIVAGLYLSCQRDRKAEIECAKVSGIYHDQLCLSPSIIIKTGGSSAN
jgi:hypothetical protein